MIPQIAHHPRPLSQHFPGYPTTPFEPLPSSRRNDRLPPLPFRSSRPLNSSSTLAPPQRAFPVDYYDQSGDSRSQGLKGHYHDPSEHMLRRKTPNGTLAAGYDGTPVQWSTKPPALKHVVLPVSVASPHNRMNSVSRTDGHRVQQRSKISTRIQNQATHFSGPANAANTALHASHPELVSWTQLPALSNGAYTVLDHMQQAVTNYQYNGMQVPTVLQPAYQPCPGPTASNDGGLYGPYWPDGRFVPYRPAAVREQTHYHANQSVEPREYPPQRDQLPLFRQTNLSIDPFRKSVISPFPSIDNRYHLLDTKNITQSYPIHLKSTFSPTNSNSLGTQPFSALTRGSSNTQFKEKTLSWAHSIYVDLLAFLHQSKKDTRHTRRSYSKNNNIYPKPPRQPASQFGTSQWSEVSPAIQSFVDDSNDLQIYPGPRMTSNPPRFDQNNNFNRWQNKGDFGDTRQGRFPAQETPHYASFQTVAGHPTSSPCAKAKEALDILTSLCEQSGWVWIDGMLLGGCLAYGLEQYHKALEWYSKIVNLDPKHVEAISNMAATLLCLNRREEAEQHWLQSVKLRPSYFEAVEHLIGLLCGDHRGKEAVHIIEFVEGSLRLPKPEEHQDYFSETSSNNDREPYDSMGVLSEMIALDYDGDGEGSLLSPLTRETDDSSTLPGFGSSGFSVPGAENGRMLALVHAKGNMLYALGDVSGASKAFENAVLISAGPSVNGIQGLIRKIVSVLSLDGLSPLREDYRSPVVSTSSPLLLPPDKALQTARLVFAKNGNLPGLRHVPDGLARRAAISTTSNSLLSLAKIFQDAMSNSASSQRISRMPTGVGDILALYYLSLSLQPSPSTANNVGILLASVQQPAATRLVTPRDNSALPAIPGVVPGSGVALALAYYNYGLNLDAKHAHLYTNLGSLLKDIGQLTAAIKMYEQAVACDNSFDIALANLANAVKDQGRTSDAIEYYRRAVAANPDFAEAVCGLANALNSVCDWAGRGGIILDGGKRDRWHVDESGMIIEARNNGNGGGWMKRVVEIVAKQLEEGSSWGRGMLQDHTMHSILQQLEAADTGSRWPLEKSTNMQGTIGEWAGHRWEGARIVRLIERAIKRVMHRWYHDKHIKRTQLPSSCYARPQFPNSLSVPSAPTVLPFHTFTCPLSAKDIRMISQRNALRISCSTLRAPWMQGSVFPPPSPPAPQLNIGYVSSDFNNHPLAHLMQSVFGLHNPSRAKAFCYATTASDNSIHRQQIEREAPVFRDVSAWPADRLVQQIVQDGIHILVNLNGYTRGARNEVFAARPAPIQMSFMGFAGTLGAEWCDYILADETAIPLETLRPWRRNLDLEDQLRDEQSFEDDNWVYSENIIFCRDTFFCCDHAQSEPQDSRSSWEDEQSRRWKMRKEMFPSLSDDAIILGNFNQLYKIEPTTFRTWLRILDKVPKAILWLLRFPDLGESNLKRTAQDWAGENVASRIWFTDVAPKHQHISRARVCDLFLDTPECNAHTTAADVLWSSTPLLTLPRYKYKMCSRMAASILKGALPRSEEGRRAAAELIANDDEQYEEFAIKLASGFSYQIQPSTAYPSGVGRLGELRKLLYDSRWTCALFDTRRWVSDLEAAYDEAWRRWVANEGGDIYL
ncbi:hypothetical protein B7494_g7281 [Chlorociboria aeruginascens]|nr:hypothetical protein B7494_g7281 [Chlorociboria aeruginascens]